MKDLNIMSSEIIKTAGGPGGKQSEERLYDLLKEFCYELYKAEWCESRNYPLEEVEKADQNDEEYNGEMYACLGEFEDCEFTDESYIKELLVNYPFVWNIYEYVAHKDE